MVSLRCCSLLVPIAAALVPVLLSATFDGRVWDLLPTWRPSAMPDQSGKVAIVTGPTLNGIGYESAVELARKGAHVILAGRSRSKGEEALRTLLKELASAKAEFAELDLGSLASVKNFSTAFLARKLPLHILLNNAGVMMNPFTLTPDGFESQFATNHLGHFLLTRLLMPVLESSAPARVVLVSSAAAYFPDVLGFLAKLLPAGQLPAGVADKLDYSENLRADHEPRYNPQVAYGRSKLANLLFARALDRRLHSKKVYSNACHPGGINTNLARHLQSSIAETRGEAWVRTFDSAMGALLLSPKQGAVTQLFLATAPEVETQDIHGRFYRPQAIPAPMPPSVGEELEEHLWKVSEGLVAEYL